MPPGARNFGAMLRAITLLCVSLLWFAANLCGQAPSCETNPHQCAVLYIQRHQFTQAISVLRELVRESPNDLKALNLLGLAYTGAGKVDEANRIFSQALSIDPWFFPARKNLAINEFDAKQPAAARANFEEVLRDARDDEISSLYLGEMSFQAGNCSAASTYYAKGRGKIGLRPEWVLHYAECLLKAKNLQGASALLEELPEKNGDARFQAGLLLGKSGAYAEAADLFESARKHYNDPYTAGYDEVLMLVKAGKSQQGIQAFQELVGEGHKTAELYNLAAEAYLNTNRVQEAYDAMRVGTQIEPEHEDNYVDLASICLEHQEYSLATDILNVGLHYVSNSYRLYIQRGVSFVMRGAIPDAEKDFEKAASLAPDKSLPYLALSWVWIENGETAKAVEVLRQKNKQPNFDYLVPYAFGVALVRSGIDLDSPAGQEAIKAFELSISRNANFQHSHSELGKLLFKSGDTDRAIAELRIATALDPEDPTPYYVLAQAYRKKGRPSDAKHMLARVNELHSDEHNLDLKKQLIKIVRQDMAPVSKAQ